MKGRNKIKREEIPLHSSVTLLCATMFIYFSGMKNREERSKHFFDSGPLMEEDEGIALHDRVRRTSSRDVS